MMKKNNSAKRGPQDGNQQSMQPEKVGWVRKFCGKGIFREIWKNRYVVLKGDQLYISEKEVTVEEDSYLAHPTRDRAKIQHSRRPPTRGHLMAVASTSTSDGMLTLDLIQEEDASPEDHGTCEESFRVDLDKSVAHLVAGRRRSDSENIKSSEKGRSVSLPRREAISWDKTGKRNDAFEKGTMYTPQVPKKLSHSEKNKCASMEEILSRRDSSAHRAVLRKGLEAQFASGEPEQLARIQELVALKLEKTQELLAEVKGYGEGKRKTKDFATAATTTSSSSKSDSESILQETQRLLGEASSTWSQAKKVLQEIKELRDLYKQLELQPSDPKPKQISQSQYRKSMM
ncbi:pleckstrin homology domain-containing family O member 1 isoform X2 [Chrysemys picta bellii]|uniref:pleckstrin homology domain-containing family O member 1 isoform X2 n=1 Tax=Chrysemys picta bellii TaxID=8478 RepID=UPI0032B1AF67